MLLLKIILWVLLICVAVTIISCVFAGCIMLSQYYKKEKVDWDFIRGAVIIVPGLFIVGVFELQDYISAVYKAGGFSEYYRKKREKEEAEKRKKEEYERITLAYKNGEIKREELPRDEDGIKTFEFNGDIAASELKDLIYVENEYNEVLNDFFIRHGHIYFKHGMRVLYMPKLLNDIGQKELVEYRSPDIDANGLHFPVDSISLFDDLAYPEDAQQLKHGVIGWYGGQTNHGAEFLSGHYFHLEEGDDESILLQLETIVKNWFNHHNAGLYYTDKKKRPQEGSSNEFADSEFWKVIDNDEVAILIQEVRERVARLHQYGVPEKLLIKMLEVKPQLSRMVITKDYRIILPDYKNMEINMEPLNKAVYLLFLRHPEGIVFKFLPDYEQELLDIYAKLKPFGINDRARKSINDVCNPCLNSINEKCARIRGAFISQFDESLAKHYFITGVWSGAKTIKLSRELVIWEEEGQSV